MEKKDALFGALIRLADDHLILGHRLSEWCGHAPMLEEDLALPNIGLDLIGQSRPLYTYAGEVEGKGRSADNLAFLRDAWDFRNVLLVEQPNGDFGQTMMRQFLFDTAHLLLLQALMGSSDQQIADIAEKTSKEVAYHKERSRDTVVALGDGTEESHKRMQAALDRLYPYVGEMFEGDKVDIAMAEAGIAPDPASLRAAYDAEIASATAEAMLVLPDGRFAHKGGRNGARHSEHLGHLLTQMQWLQRAYPGATW